MHKGRDIHIYCCSRDGTQCMMCVTSVCDLNVTASHEHMLATPRYPSEIEPRVYTSQSHPSSLQPHSELHFAFAPESNKSLFRSFSQRNLLPYFEREQYTGQGYKLCIDKTRPFCSCLLTQIACILSAVNSVICNYSH